jgi:hypothetical protein
MMKTLVLGGYGNFGARICRILGRDPRIELWIAGRDGPRAEALAVSIRNHGVRGVAIDLDSADLVVELRRLGIELVIHAAGPFQQQGYGVAEAAAAAGAHYIDLADGRRFVCDFPAAVDAAFRAAGRTAVCGASTLPGLSSAVVEHLAAGWREIDSIDICIAPAQTAPRGRATLAAVLSYCGEPVSVWIEGAWQTRRGWAAPEPIEFARLKARMGALCDVPDLELFPTRYGVTQRVMFNAALESGMAQRAFERLSKLRARRLLPRLTHFTGLLNATAGLLDFLGTPRGGMMLRVQGRNAAGRPMRRSWHIVAEDDHGPEIPCMAALLLARRLASPDARGPLPVGAHIAAGLLTLMEFAPEFARWGMATDTLNETVGTPAWRVA